MANRKKQTIGTVTFSAAWQLMACNPPVSSTLSLEYGYVSGKATVLQKPVLLFLINIGKAILETACRAFICTSYRLYGSFMMSTVQVIWSLAM